MNIAEFFIQLGVKADTAALDKVNISVNNLKVGLQKAASAFTGTVRGFAEMQAAVVAAAYGIDRFVQSAVQGTAAIQNLNIQTGLSIDTLAQWEAAGQLSNLGTSADAIGQSIANLQKNLSLINDLGQGNISAFNLAGVDVMGKDAFQVLDQIRNRIKGMSPALATNLVTQMGLSPDMINVLRLSDTEFAKLSKNAMFTSGSAKAINGVGVALKSLEMRFQSLKNQAILKFGGDLEKLISTGLKWLQRNGKEVANAIKLIVDIFIGFSTALFNAIGLVDHFLGRMLNLKAGVGVLSVAFAALALSMKPINRTLVILMLLLDDLATWQRGGKSLFGGFYEGVAKIVDKIKPVFSEIKTMILDIVDLIDGAISKITTLTKKIAFYHSDDSDNGGGQSGGKDSSGNPINNKSQNGATKNTNNQTYAQQDTNKLIDALKGGGRETAIAVAIGAAVAGAMAFLLPASLVGGATFAGGAALGGTAGAGLDVISQAYRQVIDYITKAMDQQDYFNGFGIKNATDEFLMPNAQQTIRQNQDQVKAIKHYNNSIIKNTDNSNNSSNIQRTNESNNTSKVINNSTVINVHSAGDPLQTSKLIARENLRAQSALNNGGI